MINGVLALFFSMELIICTFLSTRLGELCWWWCSIWLINDHQWRTLTLILTNKPTIFDIYLWVWLRLRPCSDAHPKDYISACRSKLVSCSSSSSSFMIYHHVGWDLVYSNMPSSPIKCLIQVDWHVTSCELAVWDISVLFLYGAHAYTNSLVIDRIFHNIRIK